MAITKLKRIAVHENVYNQLRELGKTGDSFNDVISKILAKQVGVYKIDV